MTAPGAASNPQQSQPKASPDSSIGAFKNIDQTLWGWTGTSAFLKVLKASSGAALRTTAECVLEPLGAY